MKVLFIPQWYPTSISPNAGAFNFEIAKAINIIADITVLTIHFSKDEKFGNFNIKKRKDTFLELEYFTGFSPIPKTNFLFIINIYKKAILNYINSYGKPDIIHSQDITSYYVLKAIKGFSTKIPVVVSQHWSIFLKGRINNNIYRKYKYIFKNAKIILPANKKAENEYIKFGFKGNVKWLPNSIDINYFKPNLSIKKEKWIIHISGFTKVKRVEDVIHSFKKINKEYINYRLIMIGDGINRNYFENLALKELPINSYEFLGFLNKHEIVSYLQRATCMVFPSSFETFGVVLIEAAACGCPIITTRKGGIPYVLKKNEAHFVKVGDIDKISESIINIINNNDSINYKKVSENIRSKFSREKNSIILKQIYEDIN